MYQVKLSTRAQKDLKHLKTTAIYPKIITALKSLRINPFTGDIKYLPTYKLADWRLRIGDYRILYDINKNEKAVQVVRIWHRGHDY